MPSKRKASATASAPEKQSAVTSLRANPRSELALMIVVTLLYLVLAAAYNRLIPFRAGPAAATEIAAMRLPTNPDEAAHVANAEVYRSGRIPKFSAGSPDFEAHQPPLYYVLIAPALSGNARSHEPADAARWISIIIGLLTIWASYACVAAAFPDRSYLAVASAAFIGLLPMNVNLSASITNDVLTNLVVILGLWQLVRIINGVGSMRTTRLVLESVLLGIALAAGIYTKTSTLVLFPAVIVAAGVTAAKKLTSLRDAVLFASVSIVIALILGAPWLVRNTLLYGDPVAQHIFLNAFQHTTMTAGRMIDHVGPVGYAWLVVKLTFESFWGVFDSMMLFFPLPVYIVLTVVSLASLWGAARFYMRSELSDRQQAIVWVFITLIAATIVGFARFNMTFFQAQGRYLYPALLPVAFFFCSGMAGLARAESSALAVRAPVYVMCAMVTINVAAVITISSLF